MQEKKITITHVEDIPLESSGDTSWIAGPNRYQPHTAAPRRRFSPRFFAALALMLLALGAGALIYALGPRDAQASEPDKSAPPSSAAREESASAPESAGSRAPSALSEDASEEGPEEEPASEPAFDPYAPPAGYDYSSPVPESAPRDESWFADSIFIGNSQTQGLLLYAAIPADACADVGLTVETAATLQEFDDPDDPASEEKLTALQYLEKADYQKVYLLFGINELGWTNEDAFISKYAALIEAVRATHPDAQIYVQSILPVGEKASKDKPYLTNSRIAEFNARLQKMAAEQSVYYLDVASAFQTPLPEELSSDGIHLVRSGCETWRDYILSHYVYQEEPGTESAPSETAPPVSVTAAPTLPKNGG